MKNGLTINLPGSASEELKQEVKEISDKYAEEIDLLNKNFREKLAEVCKKYGVILR